MTGLKKMFLALAVVVGLGLIGANTASAQQCTGTTAAGASLGTVAVPTSTVVRLEGTTEILGTITVACTAASPATSTTSTISVSLSPTTTRFSPSAGTTGVTFCSATPPDNKSTFPCPSLTTTDVTGFVVNPTATISNNVITFVFTPTATVQTFTVSGVRINAASTGLAIGGAVNATVTTGGGIGTRQFSSVAASTVDAIFAATPAPSLINPVNLLPVTITSCGVAVATPAGTPTTVAANPDVFAGRNGGPSSIPITFTEGFAAALATQAQLNAGIPAFNIAPDPGALNGIRIRITLTNIPSGISVYVPSEISSTAAASTGFVFNNNAGNALSGTILSLVSGAAPDGSGGTVPAPIGATNTFTLVPATSGTAVIVYEVTAGDLAALESFGINVALTGTGTVGVGAISGALSVAPVGPPTTNPARPQFVSRGPVVVANSILCASYLLFPWVAADGRGNFDTGFAIANTTADGPIGSTQQTGDVTMYLFKSDGSNATSPSVISLGTAGPGVVKTAVLSQLSPTGWTGYAIVVANFTMAHGFAFINNPNGAGGAYAEGYLAISVSKPRALAVLAPGGTPVEITNQ